MSEFTFSFDHCVLYREWRNTLRPLINADFAVEGCGFSFTMLVDSGADNIVLPGEAMLAMGLSPADCEETTGNTFYGPAAAYLYHKLVPVSFPDLNETFSFEAPLLFVPRLDGLGYGLLGREPTFNHVRIGLSHQIGLSFFISFLPQ